MHFAKWLLAIFCLASSVASVSAAEFGSREDALALIAKARTIVEEEGEAALIKAINEGTRNLTDRDLYLYAGYADERAGTNLAHATKPEIIGKNWINLRDQNGKYFVRELVAVARQGGGWVNYRWQNPVTNKIEDKSTYSEIMGNLIVSVGVYRTGEPNANTVGIISGNPNSAATYLEIAQDLADVLNDGDNLRVVPVAGIGGVQNIRDVRRLKGIDIGLTQLNILNAYRSNAKQQVGDVEDEKIVYIAKLFNEEFHILARKDVFSLEQLDRQKVNIDKIGSGTAFAMRDVFVKLGISVHEVNVGQADALEQMRKGKIAATVLVSGKPAKSIADIAADDGFHFLPIKYAPELSEDYLPAKLEHKDYPKLIGENETINTLAVSTVLISYNWPHKSDRYRRVAKFVRALFSNIKRFQRPPRHPKWREVNLNTNLQGWDRFDVAERLLPGPATPSNRTFEQFLSDRGRSKRLNLSNREDLFREFVRWQSSDLSQ